MDEHEELLKFIEEEYGVKDPSQNEIEILGKTYFYQRWRLRRAYITLAKAIKETISGSKENQREDKFLLALLITEIIAITILLLK